MNPLLYACLVLAILGIEIGLSFLLNKTTLGILGRKQAITVKLSCLAGILYWIRLFLIIRLSDFDIGLMIASIIGDTVGDWLVAKRKPKKKKIYRGRSPFTNG
jgi:hypothetical protein